MPKRRKSSVVTTLPGAIPPSIVLSPPINNDNNNSNMNDNNNNITSTNAPRRKRANPMQSPRFEQKQQEHLRMRYPDPTEGVVVVPSKSKFKLDEKVNEEITKLFSSHNCQVDLLYTLLLSDSNEFNFASFESFIKVLLSLLLIFHLFILLIFLLYDMIIF
jgi:hypothetical protein